jgi:hypothetical protein
MFDLLTFNIRFFGRRTMMKNILIVFTVLAMASVANAGLFISVNGIVNPPDSEVFLKPSEVAIIDIHSDGQTLQGGFLLTIEGLGILDITEATNSYVTPGYPDSILDLSGDNTMILLDMAKAIVPIPLLPEGKLIDLIRLHCEDLGDVILTLTTDVGGMLDTQVIHQIPEPITFALLGLGGLFLRRRK